MGLCIYNTTGKRGSTMKEEKILKFYDELISTLRRGLEAVDVLYEMLANALIMGHELGDSGICRADFYEHLLLWQIISINKGEDNDLKPFNIIDEDYYEKKTVIDIIEFRRLLFLSQATDDLINNENSFAFKIASSCRPEYISILREFNKIKGILRKGWINRHVDDNYNESDATHTVQMLALASACFRLYPLDHLNRARVYEMIIIHEIAEVIVGDIVENTDEHLSKSEKEAKAIEIIFGNLNNKDYFINLWKEFESKNTEEAKFAYELDKLDPVLKARFLDKELNRADLFDDFYDYEDKRGTFIDTPLQKLFYSDMH